MQPLLANEAFTQPGFAALFSQVEVGYEVACEAIGFAIAHHSSVVGQELAKDQPNQSLIDAALAEQDRLRDERDALRYDDSAAIEAVIAKYGSTNRVIYASNRVL